MLAPLTQWLRGHGMFPIPGFCSGSEDIEQPSLRHTTLDTTPDSWYSRSAMSDVTFFTKQSKRAKKPDERSG